MARGFGRICAASSEERAVSDTHASVSSDENNLNATDDDHKRQADVPAAVGGAWHVTPLCQFLVWGVSDLDGTETHEDTCVVEPHGGASFGTLVPGQRPGK